MKVKITLLLLFLFILFGNHNQAKAFIVNTTDMYLIMSGNSTEYYIDLGVTSAVLQQINTNGSYDYDLGTAPSVAALGGNALKFTLIDPVPAGTVYLTSTSTNLDSSLANLQNAATAWTSFMNNSDGNGTTTTAMTNQANNSNSYNNLFNCASSGSCLSGSLNGTLNSGQGVVDGNMGTDTLHMYWGKTSDDMLHSDYEDCNLNEDSNSHYHLKCTHHPPTVPLPPAIVLFSTGMVAMGIRSFLASRKESAF
jgi:hypothetical protein